jgi:putative hydrolase of the HAD superfamily
MIKTVFFDLGNVILFFDHQLMCRQVADFCHLPPEAILPLLHTQGDAYERGAIDSRALHAHLSELSGKKLDFHGLMNAFSDIFQPNVAMVSIVKSLKRQHIPLYLLSNTCEAHFDFAYTHFPLLHLFDGYILSYEVNARKPEDKIFEAALSKASCAKEECFYIDDVPEYVDAARKLKIDAEVYTHPELLLTQLNARGLIS